MESGKSAGRRAQLDKAEREHLETVITTLRDRVESEIEYALEHQYDLTSREGGGDLSADDHATRAALVEAIDHENPGDKSWTWCYEQYVNGVGYTLINRIAALRCMEVRGFIDQPVTQIGESGLTPAAEQVLAERFDVGRSEALIVAYNDACEQFDDEIELLFDTNSPYTVLDIEPDLFRDAIGQLDEVPADVWRADDVLGWVYEYYNVSLLDDLRRKGDREGLEPEDVPAANQFYTPHWVVRMLTDNSLGKLYLEHTGELQEVVDAQESFSPDERKHRPLSPDESPDITDFCTYLVPSEEEGEPTDFDHPEELRVIDPACGSGHFLLYAFDVLERIWRAETDLPDEEIPRKILANNLYGVDLDMRACQLAAFNLYLKGRTRTEAEGADGFDMPQIGIVCADASVAEIDGVEAVFEEVAGDDEDVEQALRRILDAFEEVNGLGSLLDVRGTLGDLFEDDAGGMQLTLGDDPRESYTLGQVLRSLREAIEDHQNGDSFLAQDLRSFVRLLDILAQDYDVALMNPPYGSRNRMPDSVKSYVENHFNYKPEFYINFFEVCDTLCKDDGRIGMLVPRTFMYKSTFEDFREDFVGQRGKFDFLAEYGIGVLDNATVRTVGTVVRTGQSMEDSTGDFFRLYDLESKRKEEQFLYSAFEESSSNSGVQRRYEVPISEFSRVAGTPLSYWTPPEIRDLFESDVVFDADNAGIDRKSLGITKQGLITGNNVRFVQKFWESSFEGWVPFAKGGEDAWVMPSVDSMVYWENEGAEIRRITSSRPQNIQHFFTESLAFNRIKETGRRFGYLNDASIFSDTSMVFIPDSNLWNVLPYSNSDLGTFLVLSLTVGRHWNVGEIGRIPWPSPIADSDKLKELAVSQFGEMVKKRMYEPDSPYYVSPFLIPEDYASGFFYPGHPHVEKVSNLLDIEFSGGTSHRTIHSLARESEQAQIRRDTNLERYAAEIDSEIYDLLNISDESIHRAKQEIFLRTSESPEDRETPDPESVADVPENIDEQVKDLIHHFAMEAVREEPDGIIPVHGTDDQADMLDRIVEYFEDAYEKHAEDRLVEVDDILGSEAAAEEAYPNLRAFIEDDLFDYHVDTMENTPILWKLSTERLVADPAAEGFACFVDYHQLDAGVFDRLTTQYLDPRKDKLRDRQSTANQRRNNEALSTAERSEAAETFERTTNMLDQIAEFETAMQTLGSTSDREMSQEQRDDLQALAPKVAAFRSETETRLEALAELRERKGKEWFQDTFSDGFWEKVTKWDDEWIDALEELEHACEAYAKPADVPVEAHLADLFDYFNWRLKGSDHYSSSGILFLTYYFEREGSELLDADGEPYEHLTDEEQLLASLATGLDDRSVLDDAYIDTVWGEDGEPPALVEYKALAEEIDDRCQAIDRNIPSDWTDRALSEITTAGYQPNHKHGVAINITPLAEEHIVPKIVDDKVL